MKKIFVIIFALLLCFGLFYSYLSFHYTVPILMYHSFDSSLIKDYAAVSPDTFRKQIEYIKRKNFNVLSLKDYCTILRENKPIPKRSLVITIDDGYKDNLEAIKILKEYDLPATIFVIYNKIGKEEYLSEEDIMKILKETKVDIGSHTINHTYLGDIEDDKRLREEIFLSKEFLEKKFGFSIYAIAYPSGGFNKRVISWVKDSGYDCGLTTNRAFSRKLDRFALLRIKITERDLGIRLWAKLSGFYYFFKRLKEPH